VTAQPQHATQVPFSVESPDDFRALRELLERNSYNEQAICDRYGLPVISDFRTIDDGRTPDEVGDALGTLVRLFIDSEAVEYGVVRSFLAKDELDLLTTRGLLERDDGNPDRVRATVLLYPMRSLYIASDTPRESSVKKSPDVVYPALTGNTHRFLTLIPETPCGSFLELCGGTGIAALCAARNGAKKAVSCDITRRSTLFADFNGRLNGLSDFSALEGDLYAPVGAERFDRIAASSIRGRPFAGVHLPGWRTGRRADHAPHLCRSTRSPQPGRGAVLHGNFE
jgi:hypothetical protein